MSIAIYTLLGWLLFVTLVYSYLFYDIHAEEIQLREKLHNLYEAFTEEE